MKLNWRAWHALATQDAVNKRGAKVKSQPIPKAAKKKLVNPHKDGPHSTN